MLLVPVLHALHNICIQERKKGKPPRSRFALSQAYELCLACHCLVWNLVMCQTFCVMAWHGMAEVFFLLPAEYHGKEASASREPQRQWEHPKNDFDFEQGVALHVYHTLNFICIHFFEIHFMTIVRIFLMIAGSPLNSKKIHPHFTYWAKQNKRT